MPWDHQGAELVSLVNIKAAFTLSWTFCPSSPGLSPLTCGSFPNVLADIWLLLALLSKMLGIQAKTISVRGMYAIPERWSALRKEAVAFTHEHFKLSLMQAQATSPGLLVQTDSSAPRPWVKPTFSQAT